MLKVAIIGCGEIGSRHLQGLRTLGSPAIIYLVDVSTQSIRNSLDRFYEKDFGDRFQVRVVLISQIQDELDCAIISTDSFARSLVTEQLLKRTSVKSIVFEKFLFQTKEEYRFVSELLSAYGVKAWVNQWMSSLDPFRDMVRWVSDGFRNMTVDGANWGLACNSVHFIELMQYLTDRKKLYLSESLLDREIIQSKRSGYLELTGSLIFQCEDGAKLILKSSNTPTDGLINVEINNDENSVSATYSLGEWGSSEEDIPCAPITCPDGHQIPRHPTVYFSTRVFRYAAGGFVLSSHDSKNTGIFSGCSELAAERGFSTVVYFHLEGRGTGIYSCVSRVAYYGDTYGGVTQYAQAPAVASVSVPFGIVSTVDGSSKDAWGAAVLEIDAPADCWS
jgi:predicted dehydrogenase